MPSPVFDFPQSKEELKSYATTKALYGVAALSLAFLSWLLWRQVPPMNKEIFAFLGGTFAALTIIGLDRSLSGTFMSIAVQACLSSPRFQKNPDISPIVWTGPTLIGSLVLFVATVAHVIATYYPESPSDETSRPQPAPPQSGTNNEHDTTAALWARIREAGIPVIAFRPGADGGEERVEVAAVFVPAQRGMAPPLPLRSSLSSAFQRRRETPATVSTARPS